MHTSYMFTMQLGSYY